MQRGADARDGIPDAKDQCKNEPETIEVARQMMLQFGGKPTGAYYPTGIERADNIAKCAAKY